MLDCDAKERFQNHTWLSVWLIKRNLLVSRRVARIWKRGGGGLFWKSEKCANDLDWNFHWSRSSFKRFVRKLRRNFPESSEVQSLFPPKIRWSPKKKGLHQSWEGFFVQFRKFRRLRGGCFRMGGLFSIFLRKTASIAQKTCDFAYFTSQWGARAPPPPHPWLRYCLWVAEIFKTALRCFKWSK